MKGFRLACCFQNQIDSLKVKIKLCWYKKYIESQFAISLTSFSLCYSESDKIIFRLSLSFSLSLLYVSLFSLSPYFHSFFFYCSAMYLAFSRFTSTNYALPLLSVTPVFCYFSHKKTNIMCFYSMQKKNFHTIIPPRYVLIFVFVQRPKKCQKR